VKDFEISYRFRALHFSDFLMQVKGLEDFFLWILIFGRAALKTCFLCCLSGKPSDTFTTKETRF